MGAVRGHPLESRSLDGLPMGFVEIRESVPTRVSRRPLGGSTRSAESFLGGRKVLRNLDPWGGLGAASVGMPVPRRTNPRWPFGTAPDPIRFRVGFVTVLGCL